MIDYKAKSTNICSHLRSRGYNISSRFSPYTKAATFSINGEFLFEIDLSLLPEIVCEEMILEILKERNYVPIHPKD